MRDHLAQYAQPPLIQRESTFSAFLGFRKMVTPFIIQVFFWLGVIGTVISGLVMLTREPAVGAIILVFGPLAVRMYAELIMLGFRTYDAIKDVAENTRR